MADKTIEKTRLIITKDGRMLLENKTEPLQKVQVSLTIALQLFSEDKPLNIYDLENDGFEAYWRKQYEHKIKECGEETGETKIKWSSWKPYPKNQIIFQGKGKK